MKEYYGSINHENPSLRGLSVSRPFPPWNPNSPTAGKWFLSISIIDYILNHESKIGIDWLRAKIQAAMWDGWKHFLVFVGEEPEIRELYQAIRASAERVPLTTLVDNNGEIICESN